MSATLPVTEVITRSHGVDELVVRTAELRVSKGPDRGKQVTVRGRGVRVGTDSECDLVLTDPAVSRCQFELRPTSRGFVLSDTTSTTGTFIGAVRVREVGA